MKKLYLYPRDRKLLIRHRNMLTGKIGKLWAGIFCIGLFCSCQRSVPFAFEDIEYVTTFDKETRIPQRLRSEVDFGVDGIRSFKIVDHYILVSSESKDGMVTVLEAEPPFHKLGSFFKKGNGPGELIYPFPTTGFNYAHDVDGELYAEFDNHAGKLIRFYVDRSIREGKTVSEVIGTTEKTSFDVINLGETGVFYKELTSEKDAQMRYIMKDGQKIVTKSMAILNAARIRNKGDDGSRFNVLSGSVKFDPASKVFAETPGSINAIHLYSLDDSFAKTFCFGTKMYDYNEIADLPSAERPLTSICTRQYEDFLAVLYLDVTKREFSLDDSWRPSIILLQWDGSYRLKIHLSERVDSFDIDFNTLRLFAFDSETETMYMYDMSEM